MANKKIPSRQQGFSLIELVIGMAIFLLVLLAIYQLFDTGSATYRSGQRKVDVQQNARVALDEIVRQFRMAGYYPENYDASLGPPALGNDLVNPRPIHVAMSNALAVYGDLDATCDLTQAQLPGQSCPANSSSVFLYCVETDKPNRKVYFRRIKGPTGNVNSYQCAANPGPGVASDILAELADLTYTGNSDAIIDGTAWLTLTYYDTTNTLIPVPANNGLDNEALAAIPAFGSTANRGIVRTVVVTLVLREEMAHQAPQIYSLTSSIRLRNINANW